MSVGRNLQEKNAEREDMPCPVRQSNCWDETKVRHVPQMSWSDRDVV